MEFNWWSVTVACASILLGSYAFVFKILRKLNGWYYEFMLGKKQYPLPPGDMGWPLVGNLFAFTKAFKSEDPDSFVNNLVSRYGIGGIYKVHLFGVLPSSYARRRWSELLTNSSIEEHKWLRRLTTAPIVGHNRLAVYFDCIEDIIINSVEEWASMNEPIELLNELKEVSFKIIIRIFLGFNNDSTIATVAYLFSIVKDAVMSFPVNVPGRKEEIIKTRPSSLKRLNLKDIKQMTYLAKVIDETLRKTNLLFGMFREAKADVNINGYVKPKGWKVLSFARAVHLDPQYHLNPQQFNPSRWDDYNVKTSSFFPFGIGSRLCPGMDLGKLEISIFLHYFLLNYKLERVDPECPITCFPAPKPTDNCLTKVVKVTYHST
ncbi:hypothetical protein L6164_026311 [Bauhinia variegata]|uniref:Uncharacterized protein n=1 Tax=Bauhinia variegata TaxID=167791 RepID=A0ACB9LRB7_BAUVA|nr:hypothetical protein L6164_026311 [Bauhinia variegata]